MQFLSETVDSDQAGLKYSFKFLMALFIIPQWL